MAKFDIVRSTGSVSGQGPNVISNVRFDTGAGAIAQAVGDIGGAFSRVGSILWQIQADKEFSQATLAARREVGKLDAFIAENHDEEAIAEQRDELFDFLQSQEIKNGLAGRNYQLWLNNALPAIEQDITNKVRAITIDDWRAGYMFSKAEAIDSGNPALFIAKTAEGIRTRAITKEEGARELLEVRKGVEKTLRERKIDTIFASLEGLSHNDALTKVTKMEGLTEIERNGLEARLANLKKVRDAQLEVQQSQDRDKINKAFFDGNLGDIQPLIIDSSLDTKEQGVLLTRLKNETRRIQVGEDIVTDRAEENRLNRFATGLRTGRITREQFDNEVYGSRFPEQGKALIDDTAYKAVLAKGESEFSAGIEEALNTIERDITRQLVDFVTPGQLEQALRLAKDPQTKLNINRDRQLQFWFVNKYMDDIREFRRTFPEKTSKEYFQYDKQQQVIYQRATIAEIAIFQKTEARGELDVSGGLSGIQAFDKAGKTVRVISPEGVTGSIPADELEEALKAGYKRQ